MKAALFIGDAIEIAGAAAELSSTGEWSMRQTMAVVGAVAGVGGAGLGKLRAPKALKPLAGGTPGKPPQTRAITPYYPARDGFDAPPTHTTLGKGTHVDRYGSPKGRFVSPVGTPVEMRALPYGADLTDYHSYVVTKPIHGVAVGRASPAFGQLGGGQQFMLPSRVSDLIQSGHLRETIR